MGNKYEPENGYDGTTLLSKWWRIVLKDITKICDALNKMPIANVEGQELYVSQEKTKQARTGATIISDAGGNAATGKYALATGTATTALSDAAFTSGEKSLAGSYAFSFDTTKANTSPKYYLNSVDGIEVGDVLSARLQNFYNFYFTVTDVNEDEKYIEVDNWVDEEIRVGTDEEGGSYMFIPAKPMCGDIVIGTGAFAEGCESGARIHYAHAEGYQTVSAGVGSHAEGIKTEAGYAAHAEGRETSATGVDSHAEGALTTASGTRSHAEGGQTKATGHRSHAEGDSTVANGQASHAEGKGSVANGDGSHAEGEATSNGECSHAEGRAAASGSHAHAEGSGIALADRSHAEGSGSVEGVVSHAEGAGTKANGKASHAEGDNTKANGEASHAEGSYTKADGMAAHSEGAYTEASGARAHASGHHTYAGGEDQFACGRFNIKDDNNIYANIVGNGSFDGRSNAYTLDWSGNGWFAGDVTVGAGKEKLATENYVAKAVSQSVGRDNIVENIENVNLCLEEGQDARLGEIAQMILSMPEEMSAWYKSTFSFYSGETPTTIVYTNTPLLWTGDDVTSAGRFVPQAFSTYEVEVKNLGANDIRARVKKISSYASVSLEGTMLSLSDSAGKSLKGCKIYGNSVQDGEPSAENPVPIESVGDLNEETGKYDIPLVVQGKNLIPYPFTSEERTINGVTFTPLADGSVHVKGTATASATYVLYRYVDTLPTGIVAGETYTFSINNAETKEVGNITGAINYYKTGVTSTSGYSGWLSASAAISKTMAAPADIQGIYAYLNVANGKSVDGIVYPQLELGNTASAYEPYLEPKTITISLDEPLRGFSKAADYIDFKEGVLYVYVGHDEYSEQKPIEDGGFEQMLDPLVHQIALPEISTYLYGNTLSVKTTVQPSKIEATYLKRIL